MNLDLRKIVRLFEKTGAKCRKIKGRNAYECWRDYAKARIDDFGITVISPGEFRVWYSRFSTAEDVPEKDVYNRLKETVGARDVELDIPCSELALKIKFDLDRADDAVRVFDRIAEENLWVAVTNLDGELRLLKGEKPVSLDEWLEAFKGY